MGCSLLPWFLPVLLNWGLLVPASIVVMMMIIPMPGAIVSDLVPVLSFGISMLDSNIRASSKCGSASVGRCCTSVRSRSSCELLSEFSNGGFQAFILVPLFHHIPLGSIKCDGTNIAVAVGSLCWYEWWDALLLYKAHDSLYITLNIISE